MNIIDSSAWLEFFADGPNAVYFGKPIEETSKLVVPAITIYEVFKRVLQQRDESAALKAVAVMKQGRIIDVDMISAMSAAKLSAETGLPMADSLILATARRFDAVLWTQDQNFEGLSNVNYRARRTAAG